MRALVTVADLPVMLPVAAFVALALGFLIVLRRAGRIVARTREVEGFRSSVRDLAARIDQSLDGATGRIDAVRRGQLGADTIGPTIEAATDAVTRYADEARALKGPPAGIPIRDAIVEELERAERALGMVDHGAKILAQVRRRGREAEAQTSIKRGYLNLVHAREAIVRHAEAARGLEVPPPDQPAKGSVPARQSRP
ncbi:MAG TPA: hypothetical protein VFP66_11285 [Candidatus Limnocylindrales bacterium]|nr:hypothetical protein [Candidatus Limnocylindrales bacterium]